MRRALVLFGALLACDRRVELGHEIDAVDDGAPVLTPAVCGSPPRACAASVQWWFTFGDERDDRVRAVTVDDSDRVFFAGALASDRANAWRPESVVGGLTALGRLRWSAPVAHRNRNWADTATGVLWQPGGGLLVAGQHGINGHQYVPWLDELSDDAGVLRRKLTLFDHPECTTYPCSYSGAAELEGTIRAPDGLIWQAGLFAGEPDTPLPWLERPTAGREDGHGFLMSVAPSGERSGRTFGDLRIERLTGVAALPGGDVAAIGLGRVNDAVTLLRYGRDRTIRWTRELRSSQALWAPRVAADGSGRLVLAVAFAGALEVGGRQLVAQSPVDGLLAAFDGEGALLWLRTWQQGEGSALVAVDGDGAVLVAAAAGREVRPRAGGVVPAAGQGAWVARFSRDGTLVSAAAIDTTGRFEPLSLAATRSGTIVLGGFFAGRLGLPARDLAGSAGGTDGVVMAVSLPLR